MSACSRTMARSTTWSMVVGAAAGPLEPRAGAGAWRSAAAHLLELGSATAAATAGVVSDDEAGAVVCCAIALNAISREAVIIHFQVRMTQILSASCSSVRQLENDMHDRGRVDRLIVVLGRLESHLVGSRDRSFVQAVTQTPHHAIHVQLPISPE